MSNINFLYKKSTSLTTILAVILSFTILCLTACSNSSVSLEKISPNPIQANQGFNVQPNGDSILILEVKNADKNTMVIIDGSQIKAEFINENSLHIVAPKSITSVAGSYSVSLSDNTKNVKSNELFLVVNK